MTDLEDTLEKRARHKTQPENGSKRHCLKIYYVGLKLSQKEKEKRSSSRNHQSYKDWEGQKLLVTAEYSLQIQKELDQKKGGEDVLQR